MDPFIEVMTSGDLSKVASFAISLIVLVAVLLSALIVAKRNGIRFAFKGKDGTGFDNYSMEPPPPPPSSKIKKEEGTVNILNAHDVQNFLNNRQSDFLSTVDRDNLNTTKFQKSEEAKKYIHKKVLSPKQKVRLKKVVSHYTKILKENNLLEDQLLKKFKALHGKLKSRFTHNIEKIILDNNLKKINNSNDLSNYTNDNLKILLKDFGKLLSKELGLPIWKDEFEFYKRFSESKNLVNIWYNFIFATYKICTDVYYLFDQKKSEIDERVGKAYQSLSAQYWNTLFNPQNKGAKEEVEKIKKSFEYFQKNILTYDTFYQLAYGLGMDMVVSYKIIRNEFMNSHIEYSYKYFNVLYKIIEIELMKYMSETVKKPKKETKKKVVEKITEKIKKKTTTKKKTTKKK